MDPKGYGSELNHQKTADSVHVSIQGSVLGTDFFPTAQQKGVCCVGDPQKGRFFFGCPFKTTKKGSL